MEEDEKSSLDEFKANYSVLMTKYELPSYEKLNEDFQIEKVSSTETDFLIREIRKCMVEKFFGYLKLVEEILHPVNAPMFIFSVIKSIGQVEKSKLTEIYKVFSKQEIEIIELDLNFSEEREADFIKKNYDLWQGIKSDLLDIFSVVKSNWDNKFVNNGKSYFG